MRCCRPGRAAEGEGRGRIADLTGLAGPGGHHMHGHESDNPVPGVQPRARPARTARPLAGDLEGLGAYLLSTPRCSAVVLPTLRAPPPRSRKRPEVAPRARTAGTRKCCYVKMTTTATARRPWRPGGAGRGATRSAKRKAPTEGRPRRCVGLTAGWLSRRVASRLWPRKQSEPSLSWFARPANKLPAPPRPAGSRKGYTCRPRGHARRAAPPRLACSAARAHSLRMHGPCCSAARRGPWRA